VLAARGGADLILCSAIDPAQDSPAQGLSVLHALASALSAGELSRSSPRGSSPLTDQAALIRREAPAARFG
jgi:hypothetical protein